MPRKKENKPEAYYDTFPSMLRKIMEKQGKTQQDVAEAIGKTRQAVGYYRDGSSSPDWKTIVAIANYFDCSVDYILGLSEVPSKDPDVTKVCKYTGLSEPAAIRLHELAKEDDEKDDGSTISFLFQFLHNLLVLENPTSFRDNALLSILSDITHIKAIYHSVDAFEASEALHDTEAEKKRLIDEINGEKIPCGTIEVSAETAAAIYRKRAKAFLDSAFDDALILTQKSIEEKYHIDEYRSQQIKSRWLGEE